MVDIKSSWDQITLGDFIELESVLKSDVQDSLKMVNILSILTGLNIDKIMKLSVREMNELSGIAKFLNEEIEEVSCKKEYLINGKKYNLKLDISDITTAQYVDFQSYIKMANDAEKDIDAAKMLSVWLVPEGYSYGEGYSMEDVWNDIYELNIKDAQAINFFLLKQCEIFTAIFLDYSMRSGMKQMGIQKKQIDEIMAPLDNMELCRL